MPRRRGYRRIPAALAMLMLTFPALAQDDPEPEFVEEIVVYGEKTLLTLRTAYRQSEDRFLAKFNELNTDPMLHIDCETTVRLRDRRRIRTCTPLFYRKLEARTTFEMMQDGRSRAASPGGVTFRTPRFERQRKAMNERLTREMLTLMSQNPELREAYQDMSAARAEYESYQEDRQLERFGDTGE